MYIDLCYTLTPPPSPLPKTVISWKYPSPHYVKAKVERGPLLEYSISLKHMRPMMLHARLSITNTAAAFWKNSSFADCVLLESVVPVLMLKWEASKQLASSVVIGDHPIQACTARTENLGGGQWTRLVICLYTLRKTLDDRANQKLTKSMPNRCLLRDI